MLDARRRVTATHHKNPALLVLARTLPPILTVPQSRVLSSACYVVAEVQLKVVQGSDISGLPWRNV